MVSPTRTVQSVDIFVEGSGTQTILMLHGWPDTHRLWDSAVEALKADYRCVRFALPGFDLSKPPVALPLDKITALIDSIVDAVSPTEPVTLLLHDWGCMFGYEFASLHADRVAAVIAVDIGDHNSGDYPRSLSGKAKLGALAYQMWLAVAWKIGRHINERLADRMTRWMAHTIGCRTPPETIGWQMNYPYAMAWLGQSGGLSGTARVKPIWPLLYIYGAKKPFMFHSPQWLAKVAQIPGNKVEEFATGHWVMMHKPAEFNASVKAWLDRRAVSQPLAKRPSITSWTPI